MTTATELAEKIGTDAVLDQRCCKCAGRAGDAKGYIGPRGIVWACAGTCRIEACVAHLALRARDVASLYPSLDSRPRLRWEISKKALCSDTLLVYNKHR